MIDITIDVDGDREVATKIDGMPDELRSRLRDLLPQAGEEIRAAADAGAPRSPRRSVASRKFGPLHSAIKATFFEKGDTVLETVSLGRAFYGMFQERGLDTTRRPPRRRGVIGVRLRRLAGGGVAVSARRGLLKRQGGASTPFHIAAHPFLRTAFEPRRAAILGLIRDAVAATAATVTT